MTSTILLPGLRGTFGDWAYYICLMQMSELAQRVDYAREVHENRGLSDMIQRELEDERAPAIAEYLVSNSERFFNSLVVAVYGGEPSWHEFGRITARANDPALSKIPDYAKHSMGFLRLSGREKLFALDGQHRLAGIKTALKQESHLGTDEISTIFVAHKKTKVGLRRTRRLFTTLNKTARPVSKSAVIALDEADVMAITVRRLVEEQDRFAGHRIVFKHTNNLTGRDVSSLTTIGNLYDVLERLFLGPSKGPTRGQERERLKYHRPPDRRLDAYFDEASTYFDNIGEAFPEMNEFFESDVPADVVRKYRNTAGGSMLFRPVGLIAMTEVIVHLNDLGEDDVFGMVSRLPRTLKSAPYNGVMWDATKGKVLAAGGPLTRRLLIYMLGKATKPELARLPEDYARQLGRPGERVPMPRKV